MGMIDPIISSNEACNKIRELDLNSAWKVILTFLIYHNVVHCLNVKRVYEMCNQEIHRQAKITKSASED